MRGTKNDLRGADISVTHNRPFTYTIKTTCPRPTFKERSTARTPLPPRILAAALNESQIAVGCLHNGGNRSPKKPQRIAMSIIAWIVLGLIAGFIASKIVNKVGQGFWLDIALGIIGALVGGFIFESLGGTGVTGFNLYSMLVAVIGAIIVLVVYHAVTGRRSA
jgi:uncharacterized membrane protein YeaQ/YmgE (transglycosylase-associated protein family)